MLIATIPLPGTTGAPSSIAKGQLSLEYDVDITGTTTAVGARFKGYISYTVQTSGSPVLLAASQPIAYGTNATSVPTGWTCVLTLDGTSKNVLISVTTDAADTYSVFNLTQQKYTQ